MEQQLEGDPSRQPRSGSPELTCLHFNFVLFGAKLIVDCEDVLSVHLFGAGLLGQNPLRGFSPEQRQQRSNQILLRDVSLLLDFLYGHGEKYHTFFLIFNSFPDEGISVGAHLKGELFSVIKEHEDGHLEGGDLQYVLPSDLSTPGTGFWIIFLQMRQV